MKKYSPRISKKWKVNSDGEKYYDMVCSNCGMRQNDSHFFLADHRKDCKEFKAPFVWTETHFESDEADHHGNYDIWNYTLCCNGRGLWSATGPTSKETLDALNKHQISPYQYNQTDWRAICFPEESLKQKREHLAELKDQKKREDAKFTAKMRQVRAQIKKIIMQASSEHIIAAHRGHPIIDKYDYD